MAPSAVTAAVSSAVLVMTAVCQLPDMKPDETFGVTGFVHTAKQYGHTGGARVAVHEELVGGSAGQFGASGGASTGASIIASGSWASTMASGVAASIMGASIIGASIIGASIMGASIGASITASIIAASTPASLPDASSVASAVVAASIICASIISASVLPASSCATTSATQLSFWCASAPHDVPDVQKPPMHDRPSGHSPFSLQVSTQSTSDGR